MAKVIGRLVAQLLPKQLVCVLVGTIKNEMKKCMVIYFIIIHSYQLFIVAMYVATKILAIAIIIGFI